MERHPANSVRRRSALSTAIVDGAESAAPAARADVLLLGILAAQALAFAAAAASGNIPDAVLLLFRALLTI
jgi:hypothetical protein